MTEILICDGFVIGETLESLARLLLKQVHPSPFHRRRIHDKGELRDLVCLNDRGLSPRVSELLRRYRENPDYFYREAPINGVVCLADQSRLLGLFRIKRPKRIAEKANRKIANWIFDNVRKIAQDMAQTRAMELGIPLERFITPAEEMVKEFVRAEEMIAQRFRETAISFDRAALTIHDVGAIKIVATPDDLKRLEATLNDIPGITVVEREDFRGDYQATNLVLEVVWDAENVCRRYMESKGWTKYLDRGISQANLSRGLECYLVDAEPRINVELILSTFPDLVESELGNSIHEERIIAQRDNKLYKGYIPMNVEFLVEYLFAVGFSPKTDIDRVPIKLWGRYLPETLGSYIRQLYDLPEYDLFY